MMPLADSTSPTETPWSQMHFSPARGSMKPSFWTRPWRYLPLVAIR